MCRKAGSRTRRCRGPARRRAVRATPPRAGPLAAPRTGAGARDHSDSLPGLPDNAVIADLIHACRFHFDRAEAEAALRPFHARCGGGLRPRRAAHGRHPHHRADDRAGAGRAVRRRRPPRLQPRRALRRSGPRDRCLPRFRMAPLPRRRARRRAVGPGPPRIPAHARRLADRAAAARAAGAAGVHRARMRPLGAAGRGASAVTARRAALSAGPRRSGPSAPGAACAGPPRESRRWAPHWSRRGGSRR